MSRGPNQPSLAVDPGLGSAIEIVQSRGHLSPDERVVAGFDLTSFDSVRAVVLGQDPYYQAGLAFSVGPTRALGSGSSTAASSERGISTTGAARQVSGGRPA